jgi:hypothetical protein
MSLPEEMYADLKDQLPALQEALSEGLAWGTDLAYRYVQYDMLIHIIILAIWLLVLITTLVSVPIVLKRLKAWNATIDTYDKGAPYLCLIPYFFVVLGLVLTHPTRIVGVIIKDIFIPEVRIVELLSQLIN